MQRKTEAPLHGHEDRYLVIHGHFYQPPRENPWLEAVEVQDSAAPYHDWNERITMECYGPNTAARLTTWDGHILDIRNNYTRISFNFGPTLLQWMEAHRPQVYEDIIEADRLSVVQRGGHGNSLAQPYNHTILPLATERERLVQIHWGLEDFRERFGRDPEGVWLPEAAVDLRTLDLLASCGVKFSVLAQRQARRFRLLSATSDWESCDGGRIDPTRPYLCTLPSGRSITLFFYDGPISQAVAFEGLLHDGSHFAWRLMQGFSNSRTWPQLLSIATDGESYGHHHRRGEMALSFALQTIERDRNVKLTNFGQYLARHTPHAEVQIWNNSSWSCVHGVERWRSDCGCNSGGKAGWNQKWRAPLREAFRFLATKADETYDAKAPLFFRDPEKALLDYIHVILNQKPDLVRNFLFEHANARVEDPADQVEALRLLEIMRNAQLLFTSCAWFFDEVSGIETVQNMKYAGRLVQLLKPYAPQVETRLLALLEKAPSNLPDLANAAEVYRRYVKPQVIDLQRIIAHHAIVHFDKATEGFHRLFCYELHEREAVLQSHGTTHLKLARVRAISLIDGEEADATVVVLHFGGHDFRCSITGPLAFSTFEQLREDLLNTWQRRSITELVRVIDEHFGRNYYGLQHVLSEGRRELLQRITDEAFRRFDASIRMIFEENRKFMDYLLEAGAPLPAGFLAAADFVLKARFLDEMERFLETGESEALLEVARDANRYQVPMADARVLRRVDHAMDRVFQDLAVAPTRGICLVASTLLEVVEVLDLKLDLWEAQNIVFALLHGRPLPAHLQRRLATGHGHSVVGSLTELHALAESLRVSRETLPSDPPATPQHATPLGIAGKR